MKITLKMGIGVTSSANNRDGVDYSEQVFITKKKNGGTCECNGTIYDSIEEAMGVFLIQCAAHDARIVDIEIKGV